MISFFNTRFLKFGVVGAVGMSIDFSITWFCKEKLHLNKYIANSLGFGFSVLNNFLLNRYWTFEDSANSFNGQQFVRFILVSVAGLLTNNILLLTMVNYLKKNFYFLKLVVIGLVFFWNYFANLLFTFN